MRAPIPVELDLGDVGRCDPSVERAVYFCCTEALQNAAKHAGASATARLTLRRDVGCLRFSVEDNGVGLGSPAAAADGRGIHNMRNRIRDVGGRLDVQSVSTGGCAVAGQVPLSGCPGP